MASNSRQQPAHTSDTNASLLVELKAFLKAVAIPGRDFIRDNLRNINLLSLREDVNVSSYDTSEPTAQAKRVQAQEKKL